LSKGDSGPTVVHKGKV